MNNAKNVNSFNNVQNQTPEEGPYFCQKGTGTNIAWISLSISMGLIVFFCFINRFEKLEKAVYVEYGKV